jgi:hypothetical protein
MGAYFSCRTGRWSALVRARRRAGEWDNRLRRFVLDDRGRGRGERRLASRRCDLRVERAEAVVDGQLAGSATASFTTAGANSSTFDVGRNSVGTAAFFGGTLDEIAIYGTALSSGEVAAHFAANTSSSSVSYSFDNDGRETGVGSNMFGYNLAKRADLGGMRSKRVP